MQKHILYTTGRAGSVHKVFLSHQADDKPVVRQVAHRLSRGMHVILDEWSFRPGKTLTVEIEMGIARATALILFWSKSAAASDYVQFEDELAIARQLKDDEFNIQIVRLDDTPLPTRYDRLIYHDWRKGRPGTALFHNHLGLLEESLLQRRPSSGRLTKLPLLYIIEGEFGELEAIGSNVAEIERRLQERLPDPEAVVLLRSLEERKLLLQELESDMTGFKKRMLEREWIEDLSSPDSKR